MYDLILRNARLDGESADVAVGGGRIERLAPGIEGSADCEIDAGGRLVSPPFVESHVHLDATLTAGEPRWNGSRTYYVIKRENVDVEALYQAPDESRIGDVNRAAMVSLVIGLVVTWMFLHGLVTPLQGPVARALNGLDLSWLAGMLSAGLLYYTMYRIGFGRDRCRAPQETGARSETETTV